MSGDDVATETDAEAVRFPGAEELRMVCAIAQLALREAARHGEYRAIFRGFAVQALRQRTAPRAEALVEVHLCVTLGGAVIERDVFAMAAEGNGTMIVSDGHLIEHALLDETSPSGVRLELKRFTLAVSARSMHVTHRPSLASSSAETGQIS